MPVRPVSTSPSLTGRGPWRLDAQQRSGGAAGHGAALQPVPCVKAVGPADRAIAGGDGPALAVGRRAGPVRVQPGPEVDLVVLEWPREVGGDRAVDQEPWPDARERVRLVLAAHAGESGDHEGEQPPVDESPDREREARRHEQVGDSADSSPVLRPLSGSALAMPFRVRATASATALSEAHTGRGVSGTGTPSFVGWGLAAQPVWFGATDREDRIEKPGTSSVQGGASLRGIATWSMGR